jgi:hypothetical protein
MDNNNTTEKLPDELRRKLELFTPMQRKYCEYRARGLKQADAAVKAGSSASDRSSQTRVGWNIENTVDGAKDYIAWLMDQRAKLALVDDNEIIEKLRRVYDEALSAGKFAEANKAAQLLGDMIGAFDAKRDSGKAGATDNKKESGPKNDVSAFKDPDASVDERARKIKSILKEIES